MNKEGGRVEDWQKRTGRKGEKMCSEVLHREVRGSYGRQRKAAMTRLKTGEGKIALCVHLGTQLIRKKVN